MTNVDIPELALVVLVGISGSGKSTFAREHFLPSQVLSSDAFRALIADDENDQSASSDAFDVLPSYAAAYRPYVSDAPVTLAPFAVLASEAVSYADRDHGWHLAMADRLVEAAPDTFTPTRRLVLDLNDEGAVEQATAWWLDLTGTGGEGMVVKPYEGLAVQRGKSVVQPGIKCRGREYLRIIYGPSYTEPMQLAALRNRHLGRKRKLALREHTLGLAALSTVAAGGPFHRMHELVFAILACESEPVDPRL